MASTGGSLGPRKVVSLSEALQGVREVMLEEEQTLLQQRLTPQEQDRIADGESYCFRCGRPANSFSEYRVLAQDQSYTAHEYVLHEEGTYNPATNRFACDGCYIAIGMPAAPGGWRAP